MRKLDIVVHIHKKVVIRGLVKHICRDGQVNIPYYSIQ